MRDALSTSKASGCHIRGEFYVIPRIFNCKCTIFTTSTCVEQIIIYIKLVMYRNLWIRPIIQDVQTNDLSSYLIYHMLWYTK